MARRRVFFFNETCGVGDDLMVFWATVGAAQQHLLPEPLTICFQRKTTSDFLQSLRVSISGINLIEQIDKDDFVTYVRPYRSEFMTISFRKMASLALKKSAAFCDQDYHKVLSEYGQRWHPNWRYQLSIAVGALRAWSPPYPEFYDGWQGLAMAAGLTKAEASEKAPKLEASWVAIRQQFQVARDLSAPGETFLFPAGGSFQDFSDSFIEKVRKIWPDLKVARYAQDKRPGDIVYQNLNELRDLMQKAEHVITNDSAPSHIAQFFASRHTLICSRSRPANICFPGAANTAILDLGRELTCRPCVYLGLNEPCCAAGFSRCAAQEKELTA